MPHRADPRAPVALGPFDLSHPLGRGGMGEVWRGAHRRSGTPVAVKVVTGEYAQNRAFQRLFRDEVRAVAALDHPGVVRVYDAGAVDVAAERASAGAVRAGSPWLAMELVSGGSLAERPLASSWQELRGGVLAVLDALAHAHARGVVHRDLKPGNVMLAGPGDARPGLKLTDFGLAFAMDREGDRLGLAGTPQFMAPEQFRGDWRETGPWTDLYAVGCAVWEQITGAPPFVGDVPTLQAAHASAPLPDFVPLFPVPDAAHRWLFGLLAKRPADRVSRAADAARQLASLPDAHGTSVVRFAPRATATLAVCLAPPDALDALDALDDDFGEDDEITEQAALPIASAPFPPRWALPDVGAAPRLVDAGLGLHGLREPPLVGREAERDALWAALGEVQATRTPRLVLVRGARGVGKSRLADWLVQRADELGLAEALKLDHHRVPGPRDGLVGGLWRALRLGGLDPDGRRERARRVVAEHGGSATVGDLVGAVVSATDERVTRDERWGAFRAWVGLRCRRRPLIVWVRDAACAADALGLVERLLGEPLPVLFGVDLDDDEPLEDADVVARLEASPRARALRIEPLEADTTRELGMALGLDGPLSSKVADRVGGNPLFAVQLVRDWVQRGALVAGHDGFVLAPGETATIPDDLHALWSSRVDALGAEARGPLQVAALLGQEFEPDAWEVACAALGLEIPADLVDDLLVARLARRTDDGLAFTHALLRESLVRAIPPDRLADVHRACAAGRTALPETGPRASGIGAHLLAAGDPDEAFKALLQAFNLSDRLGHPFDASAALDLAERALRDLGRPDTDPRWADLQLRRAVLLVTRGQGSRAHALAVQAEWSARRARHDAHLAAALRVQATCCNLMGRFSAGEIAASESWALAERIGNGFVGGMALCALGDAARFTGRLDEAIGWFAQAAVLPGATESTRADAFSALGACRLAQGDLAEATRCYQQADLLATRHGNLASMAGTQGGLGEVARKRGDLDEAAARYQTALELLSAYGPDRPVIPTLNLALVHLARGDHDDVRALLEPLRDRLRVNGRRALAAGAAALLAACAAADADEDTFRALLAEVTAQREREFRDADVGWALERAGDTWARLGRADLARAAWTEALEHVRDDPAVVARVQASLGPR